MSDAIGSLYADHIRILRERHDRALAGSGFDHLIIESGFLRYRFLDDMPYPFKVNPHFKAWVPVVDNPYSFLLYTPGKKPLLLFHQPVDYWHKVAETPSGWWVEHFDIKLIASPDEATQHVPKGRVATIGETESSNGGARNPEALLNRLHFDRTVKTEYEIECMRRANLLGARGHVAAAKAFRDGASEYEIHLAYLAAANHSEDELPYGNIIALDEHGATLHYYAHDRQRREGRSFLIDAGASYNGYASDITRTYAASKGIFAELIDATDAMQQSLVATVKPKMNYIDFHLLAHRKVAEILVRFGIVRDLDADAVVDRRISSTFFPHGIGHYIGLQVHDVAGFMADASGATIPKPEGHPYLRLTRVVDVGHVFTIEPGIYFIDSLLGELRASDDAKSIDWARVDSLRPYGGVRIEDDVVVRENGAENLTRTAFAHVS